MKRYLVAPLALLLGLNAFIPPATARIIPEPENALTYEEAVDELVRIFSNARYENNHIPLAFRTFEEANRFKYLPTLTPDGFTSLNIPAVDKGFIQTDGTGTPYYMPRQDPDGLYRASIVLRQYESQETLLAATKIMDMMEEEIVKKYPLRTTYDVLYAVNDYIGNFFTYSDQYKNKHSPFQLAGALQTRYAVCQAYAALANELLDRFGIENRIILGDVPGLANGAAYINTKHAWLGVKIDGKWHNFDPTWNDPYWLSSPYSRYLAVSNEFFAAEGYPRIYYTPFTASRDVVSYTEPYNYEDHKGIYKSTQYDQYIANYWALNKIVEDTYTLELMDITPDYAYEVNIHPTGQVYVYVNGKEIEVNPIRNTRLLQELYVQADESIHLQVNDGIISFIPTKKITTLSFGEEDAAASGYTTPPAFYSYRTISDLQPIKSTNPEHYLAALNAINKGYFSLNNEQVFRAEELLTYAQLLKVLTRVHNISTEGGSSLFPEYKNHWAGATLDIAVTQGWLSKENAQTISLNQSVNQAYAEYLILTSFKGSPKLSDFIKGLIDEGADVALLKEKPGSFTRLEAAYFLTLLD